MKNNYRHKSYDPPAYKATNTEYTIKVLKEEVYRLNKQKDNLANSLLEDTIVMNNIDTIDKRIMELNNNISFLKLYR